MIYELEIKQEANRDIANAYSYYEEKESGLGERFFQQIMINHTFASENINSPELIEQSHNHIHHQNLVPCNQHLR